MAQTKTYVVPGSGAKVRTVGCYSEVMMHIGAAGRSVEVELLDRGSYAPAVQVYLNGKEHSAPVTYGEGGFYHDDGGYYVYADEGPGDENPKQIQMELTGLLRNALDGIEVKVVTNLGLG